MPGSEPTPVADQVSGASRNTARGIHRLLELWVGTMRMHARSAAAHTLLFPTNRGNTREVAVFSGHLDR